jgi:transposase
MRVAPTIVLNEEERKKLTQLAKSRTASVRLARRAQIVLLAASGKPNEAIAQELEIGRVQVGRWRERYAEGGLAAIERDLPRGGRPRKADTAEIVRLTTRTLPEAATHWSTRSLAAQVGVSDTTVLRVWHRHGLKPHLVETFKVSRDPRFVEKLEDIVGLYLNPPEHALVLWLRREEPSAGTRPHAARLAAEEGSRGDDDSRLQAPRHHDAVRGAQHPGRFAHFLLPTASPP